MLHPLLRWALAIGALLLLCAPVTAQAPGAWFRNFDKDHDGKVRRDEVPAKDWPLFDGIDTNLDGMVSRQEAQAYARRPKPKASPAPAEIKISDSIRAELDLPYAGNKNPRQALDLFLPKHPKTDKPLPLVVFIHGGGWRLGDRRGGYPMVAPYVESGEFAGASIGYRLSDEAKWPAQIHDCKAAIRWLRANAKKYNLDADHIGITGISAGGHLVALLGTSGDVAEVEGDLGPNKGVNSRVACVIVQSGPTDFVTMDGKNIRADGIVAQLFGGPVKQKAEAARTASATSFVTKDDPPFMFIHGAADPLIPFQQAEILHASLKKVGVESTLIPILGGGHAGFFAMPEVNDRIHKFFEKHLLGREATTSTEPIQADAPPPVKKAAAPKGRKLARPQAK